MCIDLWWYLIGSDLAVQSLNINMFFVFVFLCLHASLYSSNHFNHCIKLFAPCGTLIGNNKFLFLFLFLLCIHMIDSDQRPDSNWHPLMSLSQITVRFKGILKSESFKILRSMSDLLVRAYISDVIGCRFEK